jgi:lysophospholipase L1-like esterase
MKNQTFILFVSLLFNIVFLLMTTSFFVRKGRFLNLIKKILKKFLKNEDEPYSPYYLHRKSQFEILPKTLSRIVFLGDSLTEECQWAELLENHNIKNRGIGGDTTDLILNRLDTILVLQPKKVFLMMGINDMLGSDEASKTIKQILLVYSAILTEFREKIPKTEVFIQSVLPVHNRVTRHWQDKKNIIQLNLQLKQLAKEFSYQYIDVYSYLSDSENQLDICYTEDGLHLNGQGYLRWKKAIEKYVNDKVVETCDETSMLMTSSTDRQDQNP